jgi:hypothetical protein
MDESDLEKEDPKRSGLESDRIIVEYVKNSMKSMLDSYPTKLDDDLAGLDRAMRSNEKDGAYKVAVYKYLIAQKNYLMRLIEYYQNELHRLVKDDSL